jgi:hypothetical protein
MKVKKLIALQSIIEDRTIPSDMRNEELTDYIYFSESRKEFMDILDMDLIHLIRAFRKTLDELQLERERPPEFFYDIENLIKDWKKGVSNE